MVHNPGADWHTGGFMHPMNFTQVENGPYDLNMYTTHPGKFDMDAGYDSLENIVPFKIYCYVAAMFGIC